MRLISLKMSTKTLNASKYKNKRVTNQSLPTIRSRATKNHSVNQFI